MNSPLRRSSSKKTTRSTLESLEGRSLFAVGTSGTEVIANLSNANGLRSIESYLKANKSSPLAKYVSIAGSKHLFGTSSASTVQIRLAAGATVDSTIKLLKAIPGVKWVSPNYVYGKGTADATPNDPRWPNQIAPLQKIQLPEAWDIQTGTGANAPIVAVIDDGVDYSHEDLAGAVYVNPGEVANDGIDNDNNGFIDDVSGWDFADNDNNAKPNLDPSNNLVDAHGTIVASIIGSPLNNNLGIAGVAGGGGVKVLPVRFRGYNVNITSAGLAQSLAYAANSGAKIINLSFSIDPYMNDAVFKSAVDLAYSKGTLWLNSAGNNTDGEPPRTDITKALFISNVDETDAKYTNSNWGKGIDLSAPGTEIRAAAPVNTYYPSVGTSFSTAITSGIAALIWSKNPTWTRDQVAAQLTGTAENIDAQNPLYVGKLGTGRVNAFKALSETIAAPKVRGLDQVSNNDIVTSAAFEAFTLRLLNVLATPTVTSGAFSLTEAGTDGAFGTSDDVNVPLTLNTSYNIGTNELAFRTSNALTAGKYRFTAKDTITDPFGTKLDGDNNGTAGGDYVVNFTVSPQGPVAPSNFTAVRSTTSTTEVRLSWTDNSLDETSFVIDRSLSSTFDTIDKTLTAVENGTFYVDWGLTLGNTYYYRVRSVNALGTSVNSTPVSVAMTTTPGNPTLPTNFAAAANPNGEAAIVDLTWVDASNNETSFQVQRSTSSTFATIDRDFLPRAESNFYTDWGLATGTTYYYRIRAVNGASVSAWSPTVTWNASAATVPAAPTTLAATQVAGTTTVSLTWIDNASNETSYVLERSTSSNFNNPTTTTLAANATSTTVTGLSTSTTYYFRVKAVNAKGSSTNSNAISFRPATVSRPSAPSTLAVAAVSGTPTSVTLTWRDNANNETSYELQRSTTSSFTTSTTTTIPLAQNTTSYVNTGLTTGTRYYWRVRAVNSAGTSSNSNTVNYQPPLPPAPAAPSSLAAAAGPTSNSSITLTWRDNASNETGFVIERSTNSLFLLGTTITVSTPNLTTYTNTGLSRTTTYYYRVRAVNAGGNSAWSNVVSRRTT